LQTLGQWDTARNNLCNHTYQALYAAACTVIVPVAITLSGLFAIFAGLIVPEKTGDMFMEAANKL
jgi:hypothetical protein